VVSRVVLDSNILISAYVFGGKPEVILKWVLSERVLGILSPHILSEFLGVLSKKFGVSDPEIVEINNELIESFQMVYPKQVFSITRDIDDNRVLEAAIEGNCDYIITGDKDLLDLKTFKKINIITANQFLSIL
jgi:uncharacterized protein